MKAITKRQNKHLIKQLLWISSFIFGLAACNAPTATNPVITAQNYIGLKERANRRELHALTGVDPVRTEWCAAFVNAILEIEGIPNLNDTGATAPLMARSYLSWGVKVDPKDIQRGDLVIFPRGGSGWQGHVGFFIEEQDGYWVILGGNQSNEVRYDLYAPYKSLGIRRWSKESTKY